MKIVLLECPGNRVFVAESAAADATAYEVLDEAYSPWAQAQGVNFEDEVRFRVSDLDNKTVIEDGMQDGPLKPGLYLVWCTQRQCDEQRIGLLIV